MNDRQRLTQLVLLSISLSVAFCFPLAIPAPDESIRGPENFLVAVSFDMAGPAKDGESLMSGRVLAPNCVAHVGGDDVIKRSLPSKDYFSCFVMHELL